MLPFHIFGADAEEERRTELRNYDAPDAQYLNFFCRTTGVGGFWNSLRVCVGGRAVFVVSHQLQGGGAG